jgi:long-chain acyl-CoA synthetase
MIKSAGHRVSPDEISEILVRMEGVQNAAVIGVDSEYLGQRIVAFVQVPDSSNITEKDCRAFAQKFLPPHMIPSEIRLVRQLPVNSNGKVNVRELNQRVSDA